MASPRYLCWVGFLIVLVSTSIGETTMDQCQPGFYRVEETIPKESHCRACTRCEPDEIEIQECGVCSDSVCESPSEVDFPSCSFGICSIGQYCHPATNQCLPCPAKTFMNFKNHGCFKCIECSLADESIYEIEVDKCVPERNTLIACQPGYFRDRGECHRCTVCHSGQTQIRKCGLCTDAKCSNLDDVSQNNAKKEKTNNDDGGDTDNNNNNNSNSIPRNHDDNTRHSGIDRPNDHSNGRQQPEPKPPDLSTETAGDVANNSDMNKTSDVIDDETDNEAPDDLSTTMIVSVTILASLVVFVIVIAGLCLWRRRQEQRKGEMTRTEEGGQTDSLCHTYSDGEQMDTTRM